MMPKTLRALHEAGRRASPNCINGTGARWNVRYRSPDQRGAGAHLGLISRPITEPPPIPGGRMKFDGHCHCGRISFEAEVDPHAVTICHCTDCQTLTGAAFRANIAAPAAHFV